MTKFPTIWMGIPHEIFFPIRSSKSPKLGKFPISRNTDHDNKCTSRFLNGMKWRLLMKLYAKFYHMNE